MSEFDQVFQQFESPDHPATCDQCGEEGTNATMEGHVCARENDSRKSELLPRLDFHIAEDLTRNVQQSAVLLIKEESGLAVAEFPNSERGLNDCEQLIAEHNQHSTLLAQRDLLLAILTSTRETLDRFLFASGQRKAHRDDLLELQRSIEATITTIEQEG